MNLISYLGSSRFIYVYNWLTIAFGTALVSCYATLTCNREAGLEMRVRDGGLLPGEVGKNHLCCRLSCFGLAS